MSNTQRQQAESAPERFPNETDAAYIARRLVADGMCPEQLQRAREAAFARRVQHVSRVATTPGLLNAPRKSPAEIRRASLLVIDAHETAFDQWLAARVVAQ